jgi:hypothetical protein
MRVSAAGTATGVSTGRICQAKPADSSIEAAIAKGHVQRLRATAGVDDCGNA